ncbi:MAG: DUF3971 domain-containing protein, partial [Xanthomonadales bacterium]|nr:DUF3971 domain-containing protein [Xanthomonadales bacterium]
MKTLRKYLVRLSSFLWTAFALVTITLALLVGVGNLLMPYADRLTPRVEDWLSRQLAKPVDVRSIEAEWAAFGPRLYVQDLVIGAADDPNRLQVDNANFTIDVFGWIRPGAGGLDQFRIKVDQIEMIRREDASWQLGGLGDPGDSLRSGGNPLRWLAGLPQITLQFDQLLLRDRASDVRLSLPGGALNFDDLGDSQRVTANVGGGLAGSMKLTAIYTAEEETTEVYLEAEELPLRRWLQSSSTGLSIENGEFSVRLWGVLNGQRRDWRGDIEVTSLEVVGEGQVQGVYRLDALRSKVEAWQSPDNRGARLVDLQVTRGGRSWTSSETAVATSAQRHRVVSDHFQVDDLLDALVLLPDLPSRFRDLLAAGSPAGILNAVDILLERSEGTVHAFGRAAFRRFGWSRSGKIPGLRDLSGEVTFNGRETIARFDSTAAGLDFGELFDGPFSGVGVDGEIRIDLAQAQPHIALPGLSVTHDQIGARLNGQIVLNGQRPFLDLGLKVTRGGVADATHYWPTGKFKEPLVRWLRNALVDGRIESGRMVLYGDLDDWPFRGNEGRFEARASVTEAVLDYRQNWPRIEDLSAELVFDEFGLEATVSKGLVKGIQIGGADVDLPRFREPILTAQIEGRGNGNALLDFLRDTPLQEDYGKYTEGLAIRGKAGVDLELRLPLKPSLGRATATGEILLTDNRIFDDKWDITFEATSGRVPFDQSGFEAVDLETTFRGTPGRLTVRAGGFVADPRHAAEGILTAVSNPGILLQDFPLLLPLGDYIEGEAPWTATITVPTGGQEPRFALSCELDPQDLDLPPPLDRPAETALPVSVSFDLVEPLQELNVQVGDVLALDALRTAPRGDWSAALQLGPGEALADTTPGVAVTGSVPAFDVDAWLEVAEYWRSMVPSLDQDGRPVIKSVNIAIDHLRLASRDFADLQLQAYQEDDYWFVDLAG